MYYRNANVYSLYGDGEAHQGTPSQDDDYWAQVWYNWRHQMGWNILIGPPGDIVQQLEDEFGPDAEHDPYSISNFMANHPDLKETMKNIVAAVGGVASGLTDTIKYLPWIIGSVIVVAGIWAYNQGRR